MSFTFATVFSVTLLAAPTHADAQEASASTPNETPATDDAERRRPLWLRGDGGGGVDMAYSDNVYASAGGAAGARLGAWTLGAQYKGFRGPDGDIEGRGRDMLGFQLGSELAYHAAFGRFEPFVGIQGGYRYVKGDGAYAGAVFGADYYVASFASVGAGLFVDGVFAINGGLAAGGAARLALHFGP